MAPRSTKMQFYRWLIWGVLCLAYIISFFHRLALGTVKSDLISGFHISATIFANLGAAYFYAYLVMQIPTGILADTMGPRITVTLGMLVAGIGSVIFGLAPTVLVAFMGRLLVGLGVSVIFVSILKMQTEWFPEREFATISGFTIFIGNLGGLLAQSPLVVLVAWLTWRNTFVFIGIISLLIAVLNFLLVRNRPTDLGLPALRPQHELHHSEKVSPGRALLAILRNRYTWAPFFMFAGFHGALIAFTGTWGLSYLHEVYRFSELKAAGYVGIAVLGMTAASALVGKFSDLLQRRKPPMLILGLVNLVCWAVLIFYQPGRLPLAFLGPLLFILGASATAFTLGWACSKEINDPRYEGLATSVINCGGFIGAAVVPVLVGVMLDRYGKLLSTQQLYSKAFLVCLLAVASSCIWVLLTKETGCRSIYRLNQNKQKTPTLTVGPPN